MFERHGADVAGRRRGTEAAAAPAPSVRPLSTGMRGPRSFGLWIVNSYKAAAILLLNTLVLLVCFELTARGALGVWTSFLKPTEELVGEGTPREKVSYYASQHWAKRYWHEFRLTRTNVYHPFTGWRRAPFKGQTINIDQNGIRVTPGADCRAGSFKVFTFGESSMWGTGSPDWETIPANLQRGFQSLKHGPVCVTNFAESAYTSTQDLITLLLQLRAGNVPDLVVFYSIGGDIGAAYESGRAGIHANFDQIAARVEGRPAPPSVANSLRKTATYSVIDRFMDTLVVADREPAASGHFDPMDRAAPTVDEPPNYEHMGVDVTQLSAAIVQDYLGNYRIVSALAQKYRFRYFFFTPPLLLLGKKHLTPEEEEMKSTEQSHAALRKLLTAVYQRLDRESLKYQNICSLVDVFDRHDELVWIDGGHVTPIGNQAIAKRMLDIIQERQSRR